MNEKHFAVLIALLICRPVLADVEQWHVCHIVSKLDSGERIELSGFKIKGVRGVYTALHGVARATKIDAIFHDPKPRRFEVKLTQADVERDVAFLQPVTDPESNLSRGGLGLGIWPTEASQQLDGKKAIVIGFPLGLDLDAATTSLEIRRPAIAELTRLINPTARKELAKRGSPSMGASMLSLQGHFLPGHSGAPILDEDRAVIGIGIGGLGEGRVGHGWATPFHEVQLKPIHDPQTSERLAKLRQLHIGRSSFLIVDDDVRDQPELLSLVTSTVESDDGTPILALRQLPADELQDRMSRLREILQAIRNGENNKFTAAGEFQRLMKTQTYLTSGTPVKVLGNAESVTRPRIPGSEAAMRAAMGQLYTKVRVLKGAAKNEELWVPTTAIRRRAGQITTGDIKASEGSAVIIGSPGATINPERQTVEKTVLNNDGSPTLVLKTLGNDANPLFSAADPQNHLGLAAVGTAVRVVEQRKTAIPFLGFKKVELLEGDLKGQTGWVANDCVRVIRAIR